MVYLDNKCYIKVFDVFNRRILKTILGTNDEEILLVREFNKIKDNNKIPKIVSLTNNNIINIYDITTNDIEENIEINKKEENMNLGRKTISNIGDSWVENKGKNNNIFSLSTVQHDKTWIITSYFYDKYFKIYDENGNQVYERVPVNNQEFHDNIISLEGFFFTEQNTFIIVRSIEDNKTRINLFINQYFIKKLTDDENYYVNFKIINIQTGIVYLIITKIQKNLSSYIVQIFDLSNIFNSRKKNFSEKYQTIKCAKYLFSFLFFLNNESKNIKMNEEMLQNIDKDIHIIGDFTVELGDNLTKEQIDAMKKFLESNNEKYNIGNILYWENNLITKKFVRFI